MSRTFRRKNASQHERERHIDCWLNPLYDHDIVWAEYVPVPSLGRVSREEIQANYSRFKKRLRAVYESDHFVVQNAPKSYRRSLQKWFRGQNKRLLFSAIRSMNEDEAVFVPFKHNANYNYF